MKKALQAMDSAFVLSLRIGIEIMNMLKESPATKTLVYTSLLRGVISSTY